MTKAQYFEMCEMLGTEPIEDEIPVEYDDLPFEVQEAFMIYNNLQDTWEYMGGNYTGKNMTGIQGIFDMYKINLDDRMRMYELLILMDRLRAKAIQDSKPSNTKAS